ncbi:MAG TPA: hypothetical protein VGL48_07810 [Acidimicrobiales bacterium]
MTRVFVLVALIAGFFSLFGANPSFSMSQNCTATHCYSVKYDSYTAAAGSIDNLNNMYLTPGSASASSPFFFNSENWIGNGNGWVETGIVNGWNFAYNEGAYAYFEFDATTSGHESGWWYYDYTTPDGTNHTTQISRSPSANVWYVYFDGNLVAGSQNVGFWTGQPIVGGECYCNTTGEYADTFSQTVYDVNSSNGQIEVWPGAAGYLIHAGMNGGDYGTYWVWNAP